MKNRFTALAAATALTAAAGAMPAQAGYTIYEDSSMPSVLFIEFDGEDPDELASTDQTGPLIIRAPGAPVDVIEPQEDTGSSVDTADSGSSSSRSSSRRSSGDDIDMDRVRDVFIDEAIRRQIRDDVDPLVRGR